MDIFPSILTHTESEFTTQVNKLAPHFNKLQIDIADNILVQGSTITCFEALQQLINNPSVAGFTLDFHLMVQDYQKDLANLEEASLRLKIRFALVHHAAKPHADLFLRQPYSFKVGLVLNPEDSVETIKQVYVLEKVPVIQIMTVIPGAQGKPFMPLLLNKIDQLRTADYRGIIMLDGAINELTFPTIMRNKCLPDVVCPGSYFCRYNDTDTRLNALYALANSPLGQEKTQK